ncbi:unnamed protein product [Rotaria magnacalcarata]|uniref:Uncharacterized protein n=7 Tax=Rotaria TaxID=231623 RepID=A0A819V938_9BILA|nr:unnamed protein product [Rotaria magnacalcarata]CAF4105636.1 unnamed protein product [Rotaria magnacalcarata]
MSLSCAIETCKRKSRAICHCCNKNLCPDHFKEHVDLINSRMNPLADEINTLDNQLSLLNADEVIDKCRQKLDKWRHECHATVDRFYEEKCQELQQRCVEKVGEKRKKLHQLKLKINELIREQEATHDDICSLKATINDIKRDVDQFEENGIVVDVNPLIINQNLVYIEQWTSNELDISTLSSPYRTIACSKDSWPAMTSNNHFLLIDQYSNLCLYDKQLTLLKEYPWEYDPIPDMCWSSTLNSFIIITGKNGVFLMNENLTSLECIQPIEKKQWLSCTCSDSTLFLTTNESGSNIFQFNLLSSFHFMKQWKSPQSCNYDELINNIAYNNETLALIIENRNNRIKRIELRSSSTFDPLWSTTFNAAYGFAPWKNRACVLKHNEWLVIDHNNSHLLHVSKDGHVKTKRSYEPTVNNAVLLGTNILAIKTADNVNCYRI